MPRGLRIGYGITPNTLRLGTGVFQLQAPPALMTAAYLMSCATGSFSLTGVPATFTESGNVPAAPSDLYLSYQGATSWNAGSDFGNPPAPNTNVLTVPAVSGATSYVIQRSTDNATWTMLPNSGWAGRVYTDTTATLSVNGNIGPNAAGYVWPANTYYYRVAGVNASGQGPWSPTQSYYVYLGTADSSGPGNVPAYLQWPGSFNSNITVNPTDTSAGPVGSQYDLLLTQTGGSYWLPYVSGTACEWNYWGGATARLQFDLKSISGGNSYGMGFHRVSSQSGGDTAIGPSNFYIAPYLVSGSTAQGQWGSYSIPYSAMFLPDPSGIMQLSIYKFTLQGNGGNECRWAMNRIRYSP